MKRGTVALSSMGLCLGVSPVSAKGLLYQIELEVVDLQIQPRFGELDALRERDVQRFVAAVEFAPCLPHSFVYIPEFLPQLLGPHLLGKGAD